MLYSAVRMEESLAELMKAEARILRKCTATGGKKEDIQRANRVIRYLLFSMMMIDDRINTGLSLISQASSGKKDKSSDKTE